MIYIFKIYLDTNASRESRGLIQRRDSHIYVYNVEFYIAVPETLGKTNEVNVNNYFPVITCLQTFKIAIVTRFKLSSSLTATCDIMLFN